MDNIFQYLGGIFSGGLSIGAGILVIVVLILLTISTVIRYIKKVPPNQALIVYGLGTRSKASVIRRVPMTAEEVAKEYEGTDATKRPKMKFKTETVGDTVQFRVVKSGWTFVWPLIQDFRFLDLSLRTLDVKVENVLSTEAVPLSLDGIAQIKIGGGIEYICTAAEQLLGKDPDALHYVARETLTGHLRAIIGLLTVEQVYKDRESFASQVLNVAVSDLSGMGLEIVSFVIKDIHDSVGYLDALGKPEIQTKLAKARIATAQNNQLATQSEQEAAANMAQYTRDAKVKMATYDAEVNTERAKADAAGPISQAEREQVLQQKKTAAAEEAAQRRNKELDAEVRFPASADREKVEQQAAAKIKTAEADAIYTRQTGTAEAEVAGLRLVKQAEGQSELAAAYSKYGREGLQIVLGQALISALPTIVDNASRPISNIKDLRVIDFGGSGADASPLDKISTQGLKQTMKMLESLEGLFGLPMNEILENLVAKIAADKGLVNDKKDSEADADDTSSGPGSAEKHKGG